MNVLTHRGEPVVIDFTPDETGAEFSLPGSATLRIAAIGTTTTVVAEAAADIDTVALTCTVTLAAEDTALLTGSLYTYQLVGEGSEVLATGLVIVESLLS